MRGGGFWGEFVLGWGVIFCVWGELKGVGVCWGLCFGELKGGWNLFVLNWSGLWKVEIRSEGACLRTAIFLFFVCQILSPAFTQNLFPFFPEPKPSFCFTLIVFRAKACPHCLSFQGIASKAATIFLSALFLQRRSFPHKL